MKGICTRQTVAAVCSAALILTAGSAGIVRAADTPAPAGFPSKPVRLLVPNAPGSPLDLLSRTLSGKLSEPWKQPVLIDNRPAAVGVVAAEVVSRAPADGHSLFMVSLTQLLVFLVHQKHQLHTEFAPVSALGTTPFAIVVNASVPAKSIAEYVALAKSRPGQLTYASSGTWGSTHVCMEFLNELAGINVLHVPHTTAPAAINAVIAEQVHSFCPAAPSVAAIAQSGKLRALGVTYRQPTKLMPGIPPVSDTLPGFELLGWYGVQATAGTPAASIARLNADFQVALRQTDVQERLLALGVDAKGSTPAEYLGFLNRETERWGKILKDRNARPE